jgi:predicted dehydrogenase
MPTKYRIAVIGATGHGDYGHGLDRVWKLLPQCELVAVADSDASGLAQAKTRLQVSAGYADWRTMCDEVRPDIVAICPRWLDQHYEMVTGVAERGIHMYLEKPMCRNLVEADAMVQACEKHQVKLAIAFQTRYSPLLAMVRRLIEDDAIGDVLELRGRGKEDRRGGGEDLWVLGSHILNIMQYVAGPARWCFAEVLQNGRPIQKEDVRDGAEGIGPLAGDTVHAMYGLDHGVTGYFASHRGAGQSGASRFGLQVYGTRGVIDITTGYFPEVRILQDPNWSPGRSEKAWVPVTSRGIGQPEVLAFADGNAIFDAGNAAACLDLIAAIEEQRQPEASVYEARNAVEMIAAVFESQRVGQPVSLPLATRDNPLTLY